jgi:predicted lysophospholipase L1 biosynthesis ABC-type transport system permease subunit
MSRGQIRAVVAWQVSVILIVAAVIGVPLGIAAGRLAWISFANSLGVVPATTTPGPALLLGFVALLLGGNLLATVPGTLAARTPPAAVLRTE